MTIAEYTLLRKRRPAPEEDEELYPSSDGEPMGETVAHFLAVLQTIDILTRFFADQPDVLVSGNNYFYYEEGNPEACVAPDAYVISGVSGQEPNSFFTWRNDELTPDIVFEVASLTTWSKDSTTKKLIYQNDLCAGEYIQFDPTGQYLKPQLKGYRLSGGQYVPIKAVGGRIRSEFLGLDIFAEGKRLRFFDPRSQTVIPTSVELEQITAAEKYRADEATAQADEEKRRADEATARADEEKRRADEERQQRLALEARLQALEQQLNNAQ